MSNDEKELKEKEIFLFLNIIVRSYITFLHFWKQKKYKLFVKDQKNLPNNFSHDKSETFLVFNFIYTLFCTMTECIKANCPVCLKTEKPFPQHTIFISCDISWASQTFYKRPEWRESSLRWMWQV